MMRIPAVLLLGILVVTESGTAAPPLDPRPEWEWSELDDSLSGAPASIVFSPDSKYLAAGAGDRIIVWSIATKKRVTRMRLPAPQPSIKLAFTSDGKGLVSHGSDDTAFRFWDARTGKQTRELEHPKLPPPKDGSSVGPWIALCPGGKTAVDNRALHSTGLEFIDLETGTKRSVAPTPCEDPVSWTGIAFAPDGKTFALNGPRGWLRTFETDSGKLVRDLRPAYPGYTVHTEAGNVRYSTDGRFIIAAGVSDKTHNFRYAVIGVDGKQYLEMGLPGPISPDNRYVITEDCCAFDLLSDLSLVPRNRAFSKRIAIGVSPDGSNVVFLGTSSKTTAAPGSATQKIFLAPPLVLPPPIELARTTGRDEPSQVWQGAIGDNLFRREYFTPMLMADPDRAVATARKYLKPVPASEAELIAKRIGELVDVSPAVRASAERDLKGVSTRFETALADAWKAAPEGELKNRIAEAIRVEGFAHQHSSARIRQRDADLRAIECLEKLGTPAARDYLKEMAAGAKGARITDAAALAASRIKIKD